MCNVCVNVCVCVCVCPISGHWVMQSVPNLRVCPARVWSDKLDKQEKVCARVCVCVCARVCVCVCVLTLHSILSLSIYALSSLSGPQYQLSGGGDDDLPPYSEMGMSQGDKLVMLKHQRIRSTPAVQPTPR